MTTLPHGRTSATTEEAPTADPLGDLLSLSDLEALAAERLSPLAMAYVNGGSWDEWTLAENVAAFARRRLWPRVLVDVSRVDTRTTLLGREVAMPVGLAPAAQQGLCHPDAEVAPARAAAEADVPIVLSTFSTVTLEEVAAAAPQADLWFQLYVHRDPATTTDLVARATAAGCRVLVVTVDLPTVGHRQREIAGGAPPEARYGTLEPYFGPGITFQDLLERHIAPAFDWAALEDLIGRTTLPVVVKGILRADDARRSAALGARGIVVSNHGGRQLDRVPAAIDALEAVADAVAGTGAEVYVDGGVRRGLDVVTALALGARGVFLGRPYLWALAVDGERGVGRALELLRGELARAMALLGAPRVGDLDRSLVSP